MRQAQRRAEVRAAGAGVVVVIPDKRSADRVIRGPIAQQIVSLQKDGQQATRCSAYGMPADMSM